MRVLIPFIAVFAALRSLAQPIPVDSFFSIGTTWTQAVYYDDESVNYHWHNWGVDAMIFKIQKDTFVSGIKYRQVSVAKKGGYWYATSVYAPGVSFSYQIPSTVNFITVGRIRVDSNKVYFAQDYSTNLGTVYGYVPVGVDHILFDFNISVGTTIADGYAFITVAAIDSVPLSSGQFINRYRDTGSKYWLWGIGGPQGLINYHELYLGPGDYYGKQFLLCYDNPSFSYHFEYSDPILLGKLQTNCFDLKTVSVNAVIKENNNPVVYPDPLPDNNLYLAYDQFEQITSVIVFDMAGKELYNFQKPFLGINQPLVVQLKPGMYIVRVEQSNHTAYLKKLIKL
jgi:hypothetical protein